MRSEIDSVDSIRELVLHGPWATVMPISVFKDPSAAGSVVISEITGVQLNRLLVLAMRIESRDNASQLALKEIIEAEFTRLARRGMFSFAAAVDAPAGA